MDLVHKWPFFQLFFFFGNIGQEHVLNDILERKTVFLGYKNNKFKKSKNWDFSKGGKPWFWSNNGHFSNLFFKQYRPEKCVLRYSRKKQTTFYTITTRSSKSRKLEIFPKGLTHGFGSKMAFFPNLGQKNVLYDILELKKRLSRLKKQRV